MKFTDRQIRDLWAKIVPQDSGSCWHWTGGRNSSGYGAKRLSVGGRHISLLAHRMVWMVLNSDIPEGLVVCHRCDNKLCCNPAHLFLGTHKDNTQDMIQKGRGLVPLLSKEQDAQVRQLKAEGHTHREIASMLGCSTAPVRRALRAEEIN
jgi:hypothetical protein